MNPIDLGLIIVIALAVIFAGAHMYKARKSGCSCGCSGCGKNCPMRKEAQDRS